MTSKVVWFEHWDEANAYQDSLTLRNHSGVAYLIEMPAGRLGVTDDEGEMQRFASEGGAVSVVDRSGSGLGLGSLQRTNAP